MTNEELIKSIQSKYPDVYPESKVGLLTSGFEKMSPVIRKSLEELLQTNNHLELNLLGYTVDRLINEHGMNEVAAHLTLDWIVREPDKALESLKRGHDFVGPSNG